MTEVVRTEGGALAIPTVLPEGAVHDPVTVGAGLDVTDQIVSLDLSEVAAGGELGGNMDAPTVDATHSGSTHAAAQAAAEATAASANTADIATHAAIPDAHHVAVTVGTGLDVTGQLIELDLSEVSSGGELGGTMDAPTVDASHSGSTHAATQAAAESTASGALATHAGTENAHGMEHDDLNSIGADDHHGQSHTQSDHTGTGATSTQAFGDAAAAGTGTKPASIDHKHAMMADPVAAHEAAADPHSGYLKESNTVDFLVGTATAELAGEIVVGATPGGELGGTWASPTIDATHSGSAHHDPVTVGTGLDVTGQLVELDLSEVNSGGELGGTLDAPTVDASHSGSTHAATQAAAEATAAAANTADIAAHAGLADPHTGYRLESADHSHATAGLQGGTVAHSDTTGNTATDHHVAPAAGPDADVTVDVAGAAGTVSTFARSGHGHKVATSSAAAVAVGTAAAGASGTAPSRGDHVHALPAVADGQHTVVGSVIAGANATSAQKGHNTIGTTAPVNQAFGDVAAAGAASTEAASHLHKHGMPAATVTRRDARGDGDADALDTRRGPRHRPRCRYFDRYRYGARHRQGRLPRRRSDPGLLLQHGRSERLGFRCHPIHDLLVGQRHRRGGPNDSMVHRRSQAGDRNHQRHRRRDYDGFHRNECSPDDQHPLHRTRSDAYDTDRCGGNDPRGHPQGRRRCSGYLRGDRQGPRDSSDVHGHTMTYTATR